MDKTEKQLKDLNAKISAIETDVKAIRRILEHNFPMPPSASGPSSPPKPEVEKKVNRPARPRATPYS